VTRDVLVQLRKLTKSFDGKKSFAVNAIDLDINKGEFITILGPSGCGKTTTLRLIAGFEMADAGEVFIDNENITKKPPHERQVNTVFQNYALFPHMNIYDNIAFGLNMKKMPKNIIKEKVMEMLKMVQLEGYESRMPDKISGGQKQRVAIARAIINNPKVLLLDEPLSALDKKLRKQMQIELKHLQRKLGITFVFVTHDQEEALTMSDRIVVMSDGNIEQVGTPDEIYERPKTKFVANFIGETNLLEAEVIKIKENETLLQLNNEEDKIRVNDHDLKLGEKIFVAIRPERVKIKKNPEEGDVYLKARLKERIYTGASLRTVVNISDGSEITVTEPVSDNFDFSDDAQNVFVTWNSKNSVIMKG